MGIKARSRDTATDALVAKAATTALASAQTTALTAAKTVAVQFGNATAVATKTTYLSLGFSGQAASETVKSQYMVTKAGKLYNLYVRMTTNNDRTTNYTVMKNDSATAMTCQVQVSPAVSASDVAHNALAVAAGDILSLKSVNAGGATGTQLNVSAGFTFIAD